MNCFYPINQAACFNRIIFKPSGRPLINSVAEGFMAHLRLNVCRWKRKEKGGGENKKTPAYAVLITILNLLNKWVPGFVCFRLSATRPAEQGGHAHRKQV
jgi:hypothetical protein